MLSNFYKLIIIYKYIPKRAIKVSNIKPWIDKEV